MVFETTVCLTLIVRDEAHVILRALESAAPYFTHWAIIDTGSRDGTQEVIRNAMKNRPGKLHQSDWKGFGASRNEALDLARSMSDYAMFLDADDVVYNDCISAALRLDTPVCYWWAYDHAIRHKRVAFVHRGVDCLWVGNTHEYLRFQEPTMPSSTLEHISLRCTHEGARGRRSHETYCEDVARLGEALRQNPTDARLRFYLARTMHWQGELLGADTEYANLQVDADACDEERWISQFERARIAEIRGVPLTDVATLFSRSIQQRPQRAEPYVELARVLRELGCHADALSVAEHGAALPICDDALFLDLAAHGWRVWDEICVNSLALRNWTRARYAGQKALCCRFLPRMERARIERNLVQLTGKDSGGDAK